MAVNARVTLRLIERIRDKREGDNQCFKGPDAEAEHGSARKKKSGAQLALAKFSLRSLSARWKCLALKEKSYLGKKLALYF